MTRPGTSNEPPAPVFLLSDFGLRDAYVGVMKAVLQRLAPGAPLVDLVHDLPRHDLVAAGLQLRAALPYLPDGAVVLAVVDPGVGGDRRGVAVRVRAGEARAVTAVAPDNGLLEPLLSLHVDEAVVLRRGAVSESGPGTTFDGRDLFAPAAGALAAGAPLGWVGAAVDPAGLTRRPLPAPERLPAGGGWRGEVLYVDGFGNLVTNLPGDTLPEGFVAEVAGRGVPGPRRAFAEVDRGEALAYVGSLGLLEIALREDDAAATWSLGPGTPVGVRPA